MENNLGDKIRTLRQNRNLNQTDFGSKVYVSRSVISDWERSIKEPSLSQLQRICKVFELDMNYFFDSNSNEINEKSIPVFQSISYKPVVHPWKPFRTIILFLTFSTIVVSILFNQIFIDSIAIILGIFYMITEIVRFFDQIHKKRIIKNYPKGYKLMYVNTKSIQHIKSFKKYLNAIIIYSIILVFLSYGFLMTLLNHLNQSYNSFLAFFLIITLGWQIYLLLDSNIKKIFKKEIQYHDISLQYTLLKYRINSVLSFLLIIFIWVYAQEIIKDSSNNTIEIVLLIMASINFIISYLILHGIQFYLEKVELFMHNEQTNEKIKL